MNSLSTTAALLVCILSLPGLEARAESDSELVFKQVSASIVTILTFDESNHQEGQGSGIVMAKNRIATNCHVLREAESLKVRKDGQEYPAYWTQADPSRDICVVRAEGISAPELTLRKLDDVHIGEPVFAIGNPLGFNLSVSSGLVAIITQQHDDQVIVASVSLSPGSSGGGLFDKQGRLLGMTTAILSAGQNLNIVLPADWIRELSLRGIAPPAAVITPEPEPRWAEEAQALESAGKYQELQIHVRNWRESQPDSSAASVYLGKSLLTTRPDEAATALQEAIRLDGNNEFAWRVKASLLHQQGQQHEAERALQKAQELSPSAPGSYILKAEWFFADHKYQEAYTSIQEAIHKDAGLSSSWQTLGMIADKLGKTEELTKAYQTALRLNPLDDKLKQALSQALARQGKAEAARLIIGSNDTGKNIADAETWLALANSEAVRKHYADAEKAFRKSIDISPAQAKAWLGLGAILSATNRDKEAEQAYDKALGLKPGNPTILAELLTDRGNVRSKLGDKFAALSDFQAALQADPNYANTWRSLGILKMEANEFKEAADAFHKVVISDSVSVTDWVLLGKSLEPLGEKKQALDALEKAEKLEPDNIHVLQNLAGYYGRNANLEKSLTYIERSLKLDSSDFNNWNNKGFCLMRLGRLPESISALETAVKLDPQSAKAWINLGEVQMRSKNLGKAIQSLEKAVELAPSAADARLFLAQSYLNSRQPERAIPHANNVLISQPYQPQALAVLTFAYLMNNNADAALNLYQKIQAKNPQTAKEVRSLAVSQGLPGALTLPE